MKDTLKHHVNSILKLLFRIFLNYIPIIVIVYLNNTRSFTSIVYKIDSLYFTEKGNSNPSIVNVLFKQSEAAQIRTSSTGPDSSVCDFAITINCITSTVFFYFL